MKTSASNQHLISFLDKLFPTFERLNVKHHAYMQAQSYVYAFLVDSKYLKIGTSQSPSGRLRQLHSPDDHLPLSQHNTEILHILPVPGRIARSVERDLLHSKELQGRKLTSHIFTEWFNVKGITRDQIETIQFCLHEDWCAALETHVRGWEYWDMPNSPQMVKLLHGTGDATLASKVAFCQKVYMGLRTSGWNDSEGEHCNLDYLGFEVEAWNFVDGKFIPKYPMGCKRYDPSENNATWLTPKVSGLGPDGQGEFFE